MWAYISGKVLILIFINAAIKYFSLNYDNSKLFAIEKFAGWFIKEFIIDILDFDIGKLIIINKDLRNDFLINGFKIIINFLFLTSRSFFLEFGTMLISSVYIYCIIFFYLYIRFNNEYNYKKKDFYLFFYFLFYFHCLIFIYGLLDIYFIKLFIWIFFITYCFYINLFIYLFILFIYLFIFKTQSSIRLFYKYCLLRLLFTIFFFFLNLFLLFKIINCELSLNENFYQEFLIKMIFLCYYFNIPFLKYKCKIRIFLKCQQ
jgi:hypothetical protein